jgi:hypothetical protein
LLLSGYHNQWNISISNKKMAPESLKRKMNTFKKFELRRKAIQIKTSP